MNHAQKSRRFHPILLAATLACGALPSAVQAHQTEDVIAEAAVPKPVLAAAKKKYPGATVLKYERETEDGKTVYEVKMKLGQRQLDAKYTPDGTLVEEEEILREADLPPAVRQAFAKSPHGTATIEQIERIVQVGKNAPPVFEIEVRTNGKKIELLFSEAGAFLGQE